VCRSACSAKTESSFWSAWRHSLPTSLASSFLLLTGDLGFYNGESGPRLVHKLVLPRANLYTFLQRRAVMMRCKEAGQYWNGSKNGTLFGHSDGEGRAPNRHNRCSTVNTE